METIQKCMLVLPLLLAMSNSIDAQIKAVYLDNPADAYRSRLEMTTEQRNLFEYYDMAEKQIAAGQEAADFFIIESETADDAVSPLLKDINYGQNSPYNNKCPIINNARAVTGCVATAMAQIMRYYSYPKVGIGNVTYTGGDSGAKTINLADYPFDWNNILNDYSQQSYTQVQGDAVASLMLACGAALNMQYSADGSGINTKFVPEVLRKNFAFDSSVGFLDYTQNPDYLDYDGVYVIREECQKGHPVIFAGFPSSGKSGHCFVIDGYKTIDGVYYYHVNWGWDGSMNGYYLIHNLKPSDESYSGYGCTMVYNIFPPNWTDIDDVVDNGENIDMHKVLKDGQILIIKGHRTYNILGAEL